MRPHRVRGLSLQRDDTWRRPVRQATDNRLLRVLQKPWIEKIASQRFVMFLRHDSVEVPRHAEGHL